MFQLLMARLRASIMTGQMPIGGMSPIPQGPLPKASPQKPPVAGGGAVASGPPLASPLAGPAEKGAGEQIGQLTHDKSGIQGSEGLITHGDKQLLNRLKTTKDNISPGELKQLDAVVAKLKAGMGKQNEAVLEDLASFKDTPPAVLRSLANNPDTTREIRLSLARNPNTPPEALAELKEVKAALALNPQDLDALNVLHSAMDVLRSVACNPKTPPAVLTCLAAESVVWKEAFKDYLTPPDVRFQVAGNPNTPPDVLAELAGAPNTPPDVLRALAENPNRPK